MKLKISKTTLNGYRVWQFTDPGMARKFARRISRMGAEVWMATVIDNPSPFMILF